MSIETTAAAANLRAKLVDVMAEVFGVAKNGQNTQGAGYTYQKAADIFPKVQKALCGHGIAFMANEISVEFPPSHETKSGGVMFVAVVKMRYTFHDSESDEVLVGEGSGLGFDTSDKALNKAKTAALKYFLKQTLLIGEEEDDSENDTHESTGRRVSHVDTTTGQIDPGEEDDLWTGDLPPLPPPEQPRPLSKDIERANIIVNRTADRIQAQSGNGNFISEAQGRRLFAIAKGNGETLKYILSQHGFSHSREIPRSRYEAICADVEKAVNV